MDEASIHRVCLWSGPRNVSTALMYAFAQRADTRVVDDYRRLQEHLHAEHLPTEYEIVDIGADA